MITIGTKVREKNNPESIGNVEDISNSGNICIYKVRFPGRVKNLSESSISIYIEKREVIDNLISGNYGEFNDFQKTLTYLKLLNSNKIQNNIYSINSSRTIFYEYQFKPLMKFLSSPKRRVMICDEVGLGKTIEAGLIIKELDARREINRVLIVVPANLRKKWVDEMFFRFNDNFTVINAKEFKDIIEEKPNLKHKYKKERYIISLESIRSKSMMDIFDNTDYQWDLLIVDEAHSLRNSSHQHTAIKKLSVTCDSIVFLTATPIHTERKNLFNIINILDEQQFPYFDSFENQLRINEPIIKALNLISQIPPLLNDAIAILRPMENVFKGNEIYLDLMRELNHYKDLQAVSKHEELEIVVEIQRLLSDLHFLGSTYTRTRKRDVTIGQAERKPQTRRVAFSEEEKSYYTGLLRAIRTRLGNSYPTNVFTMFSIQRMLSSSLHAHGSKLIDKYMQDECLNEDYDLEESDFDYAWLNEEPNFPDSKLADLQGLLSVIRQHTSKVILFAFYIPTLKYLERRLSEANYKTFLMHGQTKQDRPKIISDFRNASGFSILLSSRVGSEGIDLQFCDTMINYDLPWNPMEIEQRIGRIDRIGQKSPFLNIYNYGMVDTIDDEIVTRLYDRISLFESSIGLLEPIMGEILDNIAKRVFFRDQSDEDKMKQFHQEELILVQKMKDLHLLEDKSSEILSLDYFYEHEIKDIKGKNRYISPEQLFKYLVGFLGVKYPDSLIKYDLKSNIGELILCESFMREVFSKNLDIGVPFRFGKNATTPVKFTMDSDVAFENSELTFITIMHPLVSYITQRYSEDESSLYNTQFFCISKEDLDIRKIDLQKGFYFYFQNTGSIVGVRTQSYLMPVIMDENLDSIGNREYTEQVMSALIECGKPSIHKFMCDDEDYLRDAYAKAKDICQNWFINLYHKQKAKHELVLQRKEESIRYNYDRKIQHQTDDREKINMDEAELDKNQKFRLEMINGKINKLNQNLQIQLMRLNADRNIDLEFDEPVLGGIFELI